MAKEAHCAIKKCGSPKERYQYGFVAPLGLIGGFYMIFCITIVAHGICLKSLSIIFIL